MAEDSKNKMDSNDGEDEEVEYVTVIQQSASTSTSAYHQPTLREEHTDFPTRFARSATLPVQQSRRLSGTLYHAAGWSSAREVDRLITSGADTSTIIDNQTPLYVAAEMNNMETVEALLNNRADPNLGNEFLGQTPLFIACQKGHVAVVKTLLEHHADPNIENKLGESPLYAILNSEWVLWGSQAMIDIVTLLLEHGADPNILDQDDDRTPLQLACTRGDHELVAVLLERGATVNKHDQFLIDMFEVPTNDTAISQGRDKCLEILEDKGIFLGPKDTTCDLSCEVSVSSPSIDRWEYGLSIDIDPSSLHPSSRYVANIKVYSEPDQFSFPMGCEPLSAVYSISFEGNPLSTATPPTMALKMMHFVDPNDVEQLNQLTFAKMTDHSSLSQFKIVPGGSFRLDNRYGEIRLHHTSFWSIVQKIIKRGPPLYRGVVLYTQTSPIRWIMHLLVSRYKPKQMIALNNFIRNEYGSSQRNCEPDFIFKFNKSKKLKMITREEMDESLTMKCSNGWTIALDIHEISQETADWFNNQCDIPGRCVLQIETQDSHKEDEDMMIHLEGRPMVELSGIDSDKKYIRIDPPIGESKYKKSNELHQETAINGRKSPLTAFEVFQYLRHHSVNWDDIGRELKVPHNYRNALRIDLTLTAEGRLESVIDKWIQAECSPVTWDNLLEVLQHLGYNRTRRKIEDTMMDYSSNLLTPLRREKVSFTVQATDSWRVVVITLSVLAVFIAITSIPFIAKNFQNNSS